MVIKEAKRPWIKNTSGSHRHDNRNDREFNYQSSAWRNTSKAFLTANPVCFLCGKPSKISDHKVRIKDGGDPYNWANLQPMCSKCHNRKDNNTGKYEKT